MKKTLITAAALVAAVNIYAQGTVTFANASASAISNSLTSARVASGTTFKVALYYLPDSPTAPTAAEFDNATILLPSVGFAAPGIFAGGTRSAPTTGGGAGWFQVRAWETAFGDTYENAVRNSTPQGGRLALVGTSNIIKVNLGNPTITPPTTAGTLVGAGLQAFYVVPVPEPTTIGLGLLGLGALLALRRRK